MRCWIKSDNELMILLIIILRADFSNFKEFGSVWERSHDQTFDCKGKEELYQETFNLRFDETTSIL